MIGLTIFAIIGCVAQLAAFSAIGYFLLQFVNKEGIHHLSDISARHVLHNPAAIIIGVIVVAALWFIVPWLYKLTIGRIICHFTEHKLKTEKLDILLWSASWHECSRCGASGPELYASKAKKSAVVAD